MNLHDFIILVTLPIGTSGYNEIQMILLIGTSKYNISEYILKLQIHQHSLLTRKVFSRHNLSAQVLFSISSGSSSSHLHLQVIFIVKSSLDLDHHWIIIKVGSSLDHHHHHCFRYLNQMMLSLHYSHHMKFYRAIPFSCWL